MHVFSRGPCSSMTRLLLMPLLAMTLSAAACGTTASPPPPTPPGGGSTSASPGVQNVTVVNAGIGAYEETILPVAILKNLSRDHSALRLTITWTVTTPRGGTFGTVGTTIAVLGPGQTTVVGARMAGQDVGGTATATVDVGGWTTAVSAAITAAPGVLTCGPCGPNAGVGTVTTTLTSDSPHPPSPLSVGVACLGAGGAIDGGGSKTFSWTAGGVTAATSVPVLINGSPATCIVGATPAS